MGLFFFTRKYTIKAKRKANYTIVYCKQIIFVKQINRHLHERQLDLVVTQKGDKALFLGNRGLFEAKT